MSHPQRVGLLGIVCWLFASFAHACLWDWDTLQMERRRFPGVLETMTGKFVRHSPAYYEWRIQDRTRRMLSPAENPEVADDLAVAYSKLGDHAKGISLLEQVLRAHPDRYETLANLGTIHMLAGDLKTGKDYIDRALVINPDAHFGRERYQSLLAEYFLTERKTPHPASEQEFSAHHRMPYGFAEFVLKKRIPQHSEDSFNDELAAAQKGILGMMHFANYDLPALQEVLGDVLMAYPNHQQDAMQLAARAYYRIAEQSEDEQTRQEFQTAARNMLNGHVDYIHYRGEWNQEKNDYENDVLDKLSSELRKERADAEKFVAAIAADERRWIDAGANVDAEFAAKYYDTLDDTIDAAKKQLARERRDERSGPFDREIRRAWIILAAIAATLVLGIYAIRRYLRRSRV